MGNFLLLLRHLGGTTGQRSVSWLSPSSAGAGLSGSYSVFSGVFRAEKVDKGSVDTATVDVQLLLEATLNMSLRSVSFIDVDFSDKMQNFQF